MVTLDPHRASTVVLCRITTKWPHKILLVQRSKRAAFLPGAHVFPGGRVDISDQFLARFLAKDVKNLKRINAYFNPPPSTAISVATGIRETLEEAGISILCVIRNQEKQHVKMAALAQLIKDASFGEASLMPVLDNMWPISWWVTPKGESRRFDTIFFFATISEEMATDETLVSDGESIGRLWVCPKDALNLHEKATIFLPPPTRSILERMVGTESIDHFLSFVDKPLWPIHPQFTDDTNGKKILVLLGDPLHPKAGRSAMPVNTRYTFPI